MKITFIIIAKNKEEIEIDTSRLLNFKEPGITSFEIVCAYGLGPSKQRNEAIKIASGDWLYLIDNDSYVDEQSIAQFLEALKLYPEAAVVGGPSIVKDIDNDWQKAIQVVFSSDVGIGPIKSRYTPIGRTRKTSDKELILCNLLIKKEVFEKMGGFNESLYPNEENEFLARLKNFGTVIYSPQVIVYRKHRDTYSQFFLQMYRYGQGRTRHLLFSKHYNDYVYFLPLVFGVGLILSFIKIKLFLSLVILYLIIITPIALIHFSNYPKNIFLLKIYNAFIMCHMGYALGLLGGFFEKKLRNVTIVKTEIIKN